MSGRIPRYRRTHSKAKARAAKLNPTQLENILKLDHNDFVKLIGYKVIYDPTFEDFKPTKRKRPGGNR